MKESYQRLRSRAFSSSVNHKKLYKKGKYWVVSSLTLLALAGLGYQIHQPASAASTNPATVSSASGTEHQAKAVYNRLVAHQITQAPAASGSQAPSTNSSASSSSAPVDNPAPAKPKLLDATPSSQKVWADIQYTNAFNNQPVASDAKPNEPIDPNTIGNYAKLIPGCSPFLGGNAFPGTTVPTTSKDNRDTWTFSFTGSPSGKPSWKSPNLLPPDLRPATPSPSKPSHPDNSEYANQTITVHYINDTPGEPTYGQEMAPATIAHWNQSIDTSNNTAVWKPDTQIADFIGYDKNGNRHIYTEDEINRDGDHYNPTASEDQYPVGYHLVVPDQLAWEEGTNIVSDISQDDASDQNGTNHKSIHPFFFMPYNQNVYLYFRRAKSYINMYYLANNPNGPTLKPSLHFSDITNHPVNLVPDVPMNIDGFKYSPYGTGQSIGYNPFTLKNFDNAIVDPKSKVIDDIYSVYVPASDKVTYTYNGTPVATGMQATRPSDPSKPDTDNNFRDYDNDFSQHNYLNLPSQYSIKPSDAQHFEQQFQTDVQNHNYGYGYYNYVIPVHLKTHDTVNYTYNGHVITEDGHQYSKQFNGDSDQSDFNLNFYYHNKANGDWDDAPADYLVTSDSKAQFFSQMASYFADNHGDYSGTTINIPLAKPSAQMHIYYETPSGQQIQPETRLSDLPGMEFDIHAYRTQDYAPNTLTNDGIKYQQTSIMHPATAFDSQSGQTHTIDVIYQPVQNLQPITVHYLNSDHQSLADNVTVNPGSVNADVTNKTFTNYKQTGQIGSFDFKTYPQNVYFTYKSTIKPKPKIITKPGKTKVITKTVPGKTITKYVTNTVTKTVPGPTKYITKTIPGKTVTKYINVPGPTKYITKNVPGPVQYVTKNVPGPTKYVNVPGPTKYVNVPGPTKYINVPGKTKYITKNVPGPVRYVTKNVPGPTKYVTKTVTRTIDVPGPVRIVKEPGKTITKVVKVQTPPEIIHEPGKTVTKYVQVPGPVRIERVPGPTVTKVVYAPSQTKVIYRTITKNVPGPTKYVKVPCHCHVVNHLKVVQVPEIVIIVVSPNRKHRRPVKHARGKVIKISQPHKTAKSNPQRPRANRSLKPFTKRTAPKRSVIKRQHPVRRWIRRHHLSVARLHTNGVRPAETKSSQQKSRQLPQTSEPDSEAVELFGDLLLIIGLLTFSGVDLQRKD